MTLRFPVWSLASFGLCPLTSALGDMIRSSSAQISISSLSANFNEITSPCAVYSDTFGRRHRQDKLYSRGQSINRVKSSLLASSPRFFSTNSLSTIIFSPRPPRSAASNETSSSRRSKIVCRRRAPIFSVPSFTS